MYNIEGNPITNKLEVFVKRSLGSFMCIDWPNRISHKNLWRDTGKENVSIKTRHEKWRWLDHTLRRIKVEIAKKALKWNLEGHRKRGRPERRKIWIRTGLKKKENNEESHGEN